MAPSQPAEYTVKSFTPGDFRDQNGNAWCKVTFNEYSGEPITWVVKDPSTVQVGQKVYGHMEMKTSQKGSTYQRFYRDQRQQQFSGGQSQGQGGKPAYQPKNEEAIAKAVALKAAVEFAGHSSVKSTSSVLEYAKTFLDWLEDSPQQNSPHPDREGDEAVHKYQQYQQNSFDDEPMPEYQGE